MTSFIHSAVEMPTLCESKMNSWFLSPCFYDSRVPRVNLIKYLHLMKVTKEACTMPILLLQQINEAWPKKIEQQYFIYEEFDLL